MGNSRPQGAGRPLTLWSGYVALSQAHTHALTPSTHPEQAWGPLSAQAQADTWLHTDVCTYRHTHTGSRGTRLHSRVHTQAPGAPGLTVMGAHTRGLPGHQIHTYTCTHRLPGHQVSHSCVHTQAHRALDFTHMCTQGIPGHQISHMCTQGPRTPGFTQVCTHGFPRHQIHTRVHTRARIPRLQARAGTLLCCCCSLYGEGPGGGGQWPVQV